VLIFRRAFHSTFPTFVKEPKLLRSRNTIRRPEPAEPWLRLHKAPRAIPTLCTFNIDA
jgi:hypothetical protein